jgi:hypothetical protein
MTDLKERFAVLRDRLDRLDPPHLWDEIERRSPSRSTHTPSASSRWLVAAFALAIGVGGIALTLQAFGRSDRSPAGTTPVPGTSGLPPIGAIPDVTVREGVTLDLASEGGVVSAGEAFGSLWVGMITDQGQPQVARVDPSTGEIQHTFAVDIQAWEWGGDGIVIGAGSVWVPGGPDGGGARIARIDPATDQVEVIDVPGRAVSSLSFDGNGRLWASISLEGSGEDEIAELDPATGDVLSKWPFHAEWSHGVYPAQGTAWIHEMGVKNSTVEGGWLTQIVPGDTPSVTIGGTFAEPVSDGTALWTPFHGDERAVDLANGIARIDPRTGQIVDEWKTASLGYDLAIGDDGGVWFLSGAGLERLNPSTGETDVDQPLPGTPIFIAPSVGGLWIGTYDGKLIRYDVMLS